MRSETPRVLGRLLLYPSAELRAALPEIRVRLQAEEALPPGVVASLAELNAKLAAIDEADDARRINGRLTTIGQDFAIEAPLLRPLPFEAFEPGLLLTPRVDRHARITVRNCH